MYTPKPKNMAKFLVNISSAQALHTWEYADKSRQAAIGSNGTLSARQRHKRELNRKTIGAYRDSQLANVATSMRGEVVQFTQAQRQKITSRREAAAKSPPIPPRASQKDRPAPSPSIYRPKI